MGKINQVSLANGACLKCALDSRRDESVLLSAALREMATAVPRVGARTRVVLTRIVYRYPFFYCTATPVLSVKLFCTSFCFNTGICSTFLCLYYKHKMSIKFIDIVV